MGSGLQPWGGQGGASQALPTAPAALHRPRPAGTTAHSPGHLWARRTGAPGASPWPRPLGRMGRPGSDWMPWCPTPVPPSGPPPTPAAGRACSQPAPGPGLLGSSWSQVSPSLLGDGGLCHDQLMQSPVPLASTWGHTEGPAPLQRPPRPALCDPRGSWLLPPHCGPLCPLPSQPSSALRRPVPEALPKKRAHRPLCDARPASVGPSDGASSPASRVEGAALLPARS